MKAHDGIRTRDLFLTKEVLYRLSYVSVRAPVKLFRQYPVGESNPCLRRERALS